MRKIGKIVVLFALFTLSAHAGFSQVRVTQTESVVVEEVIITPEMRHRPSMEERHQIKTDTMNIEVATQHQTRRREISDFYYGYNTKKISRGHWAGFGLGYSGLVDNLGNLALPEPASYLSQMGKSINVNINFFDYSLLASRHALLFTGLGLEINNFRLERDITLKGYSDGTGPFYFDEQLKKTKLVTCYVNVPLIVEFQFGDENRCFVNFGVVGGLKLNAHTKYKSAGGQVVKNNKGLNIKNFHYGFTTNIGYGHVGISATYYPESIFKDNLGPGVRQANVGLMLFF